MTTYIAEYRIRVEVNPDRAKGKSPEQVEEDARVIAETVGQNFHRTAFNSAVFNGHAELTNLVREDLEGVEC